MRDTFQILAKFIERFGDEVEGRELQEPSQDTKVKLQQLARGTLSEPQRAELFLQLHHNPQWLPWLAQEVKALRGDAPDKVSGTSSA
ncbi:MAG TPA: hypothetical protein VN578_17680 [Candidatus Binatia bacterium]|jgi:hypothetical protein|nr:hypothetical protein [Candidatus Binatia bacterium]